MASIFTKIVNGDIPSHKIAENDHFYAFLDIRPLAKGHTLVIPKQEVDYYFDLEDELLAGLMVFAKKVAKGLKAAISCNRIGVSVVGLEVP
ncbi:MAG: HIT family protein, partial [Bacteroidota bacterium]